MEDEYPKLRTIEAIAVQEDKICLRDPMGISDKLVYLSPDIFYIVSLFDGKHSILDIQTAYTRRFGNLLFSDRVRQIIEQLDSCLFLESVRFHEARDRIIGEYRESPLRPASHSGISYEKEAEALTAQLREIFNAFESATDRMSADRGSAQNGSALSGPAQNREEEPSGLLTGLIAPHIDIKRGGNCFAASYTELLNSCDATTFVILGISHAPTERRFVLTAKDFGTPLGTLPVDQEFIEDLTNRCTTDFFEDELVHRSEHSVEFQAVFLRYLYPDKPDIKIVPILCGSLDQVYTEGSPSREDEEFQEFTAALKELVTQRGNHVCCVAGVDLSHLGRRFGQNLTITQPLLEQAREDDRRMMQRILDLDGEGFFRFIQDEKDRRNVCGVPAIYTLLSVLDARCARLLSYDQAVDYDTQSVVTFMGAALYK